MFVTMFVAACATTGLHLHCLMQFVGCIHGNLLAIAQLTIVGNDGEAIVTMQQADRNRFEFDESLVGMVIVSVAFVLFCLMFGGVMSPDVHAR